MSFADQVDVFYGRVSHNKAEVYVRIGTLVGGGEWSITGQARGPIAPGTRTLPTTVPLTDLGEGATLLGGCSIPDPAFWTTQLPGTYELSIELCRAGEVVETFARSIGIRFVRTAGRDFLWEGKRSVLRGVAANNADVQEIDDFTDNAGMLVVKHPSESLLREASTKGVLLAVEVDSGEVRRALRRVGRWPAVAIAILPSGCGVDGELRAVAPNLLFAQRIDPRKSHGVADWAEVVFCDAIDVNAFDDATKPIPIPIVAERTLRGECTLTEARRECDHLQRDLAPLGDFAGYVVHAKPVGRGGMMEAE